MRVDTHVTPEAAGAREFDLEKGVEKVNEFVSKTDLEFVERSDTVYITGNVGTAVNGSGTAGHSDCGDNDIDIDTWNVPPRASIYLDNYWSGRVCAGTGIIAALSGAGVISGPGAVPAWVVTAAAGVSAALICANNEGCGVRIRVYQTTPGPVPKVDPQDNTNNSWI